MHTMETIGALGDSTSLLDQFAQTLRSQGLSTLAKGVIGDGAKFGTPFGTQSLLYADYVASGRALRQVETFVMDEILPYYANSHTEASFCGAYMTRLRTSARATIARLCNAPPEKFTTIFMGNGATAGLNRLVHLLEIPARCDTGQQPTVFIGPYEHHSNILPWRESGARIVEIPEGADGGPDMTALETALTSCPHHNPPSRALSAPPNAPGILTAVNASTALPKRVGPPLTCAYP